MYKITPYTYQKAKEIGVEVHPSHKKNKKIDVYMDSKYIKSIGHSKYGDFPSFVRDYGKEYAEERRRLYHGRHKKNTLGEKLALKLLW